MRRVLAVVLGALAAVLPASAARADADDPLHILVVGDSISVEDVDPAYDWQTYLSDLLTEAGVDHTISTHAHGGWRCLDWIPTIRSIVDAEDPDIVILACGTNDAAGPLGGMDWTYSTLMLETLLGHAPTRILATWVQYSASRPALAASLRNGEALVNDAIYRQTTGSVHGTRIIGVADFQQIPEQYLSIDGVHPTQAGYEAMGRIVYDRLRLDPAYPWPDVAPALCGMTGHRPGGSPPSDYLPCTVLAT